MTQPSPKQVQELLAQPDKHVMRPFIWQQQASGHIPKIYIFESAVQVRQQVLEGLRCPLCGSPVQENSKAFGCANWKSGCRFTLWKNALKRVKGPMLNQRIVKTLLTEGKVEGTTGLIRLDLQ